MKRIRSGDINDFTSIPREMPGDDAYWWRIARMRGALLAHILRHSLAPPALWTREMKALVERYAQAMPRLDDAIGDIPFIRVCLATVEEPDAPEPDGLGLGDVAGPALPRGGLRPVEKKSPRAPARVRAGGAAVRKRPMSGRRRDRPWAG